MSPSNGTSLPALRLLPLFLVSLVAIGTEIALTRFFALASWAEYGYWVISIAMVGLTASGVVASSIEPWLQRHGDRLIAILPLLLIVTAAGGWFATTSISFNPLELQNRALWTTQVGNILKYYAALFPFFFLTGLYISLYFLLHSARIAQVYAYDLAGAGVGALLVLALMFVLHPFDLLAALLPLLLIAVFPTASMLWRRKGMAILVLSIFALAEWTILASPARINEYKEIFGPLNAAGGRIVHEVRSPKGLYQVLDAFTERVDTDLSNNWAGSANAELPRTYGLYQDGNRVTSLPKAANITAAYSPASLDALPYALRPRAEVMLLGASGGFRIAEALTLGASGVVAIEPDRVLLHGLRHGFAPAPPLIDDPRVELVGSDPLAAAVAAERRFRLVDVSRDFLVQADTNRIVLSSDGMRTLLQRLAPDGVLSIPISIREFTNYAAKAIATVDLALRETGDAQTRVLIYRSAWNMRILIAAAPWSPEDIEVARAFCRERSFDIVYFPGIDPAKLEIFNEVPVVTFAEGPPPAVRDALSIEAASLLNGQPSPFHGFFDLRPASFDRPAFFATLPPAGLPMILAQIERVPREELSFLINIAVLLQAIVIAAIVLLLPLLRAASARPPLSTVTAAVVYFSGLGLGFLWLEIFLIEKIAHYTHDRTLAFALVLATMLMASGVGSFYGGRFADRPKRGLGIAVCGILVWCIFAWFALDPLLAASAAAPLALQTGLVLALVAPLAFCLGLPMAIGLAQFAPRYVAFLPWAWAVNGAWSIVATPLANLIALTVGLKILVAGAAVAYLSVWLSLPGFLARRQEGREGAS